MATPPSFLFTAGCQRAEFHWIIAASQRLWYRAAIAAKLHDPASQYSPEIFAEGLRPEAVFGFG